MDSASDFGELEIDAARRGEVGASFLVLVMLLELLVCVSDLTGMPNPCLTFAAEFKALARVVGLPDVDEDVSISLVRVQDCWAFVFFDANDVEP